MFMLRRCAVLIAVVIASVSAAWAGPAPDAPDLRFAASVRVSFLPADQADRISPVPQLDPASLSDAAFPQQATPQPLPQHTGLSALWRGTISDFVEFPQRKSTWILLAGGAVAALAVHPVDDEVNAKLQGSTTADRIFAAGKYLGGWTQAGVAIGTYVVGRYMVAPAPGTKHSNKVSHLGFDLLRAQLVTQALTQGIKVVGQRKRPTGECCSFPSGHSSATFATAAVLERHLGLRGAWPTLLAASYVAVSRLNDNRHFLSDVVFGAALGTATGWTVVGRHGKSNFTWIPVHVPGGVAILVTRNADR